MIELKTFFRQRDAVVFTFSLPAVLLLVLGSVFTDEFDGTGITVSQLFAAGMIAGGIASTSFVNLGIGIATDRDDGTLKRLRGTPMPPVSYFIGKVILVLVASLAEVVMLLATGMLVFDLTLPTDVSRWFTFAWVFVLGVTGCSLLGIAASSIARIGAQRPRRPQPSVHRAAVRLRHLRRARCADLPEPLVQIGSLFPLKWMAQGFRSVFLPDVMAGQEVAGAWEHGRVALVLAAWCIGGLILCLTTFRWRGRRDR